MPNTLLFVKNSFHSTLLPQLVTKSWVVAQGNKRKKETRTRFCIQLGRWTLLGEVCLVASHPASLPEAICFSGRGGREPCVKQATFTSFPCTGHGGIWECACVSSWNTLMLRPSASVLQSYATCVALRRIASHCVATCTWVPLLGNTFQSVVRSRRVNCFGKKKNPSFQCPCRPNLHVTRRAVHHGTPVPG